MTQQEFTDRTGLTPTAEEFNYIRALYMNCVMDKDAFCKDFKKHGASSIMKDVHAVATGYCFQARELQDKFQNTAEILLGKACAYEDRDMYNEAIRLIGKKEVVLTKVDMGLPLWEEDMEYIKRNLQ